ncbi:uncharacterized protein LJ206_003447 isoform 1-T1 [Theristicus caerulescens]
MGSPRPPPPPPPPGPPPPALPSPPAAAQGGRLRALHWEPVPAARVRGRRSVWAPRAAPPPLDLPRLRLLFREPRGAAPGQRPPPAAALLEPKRSLALGVFLKQVKRPVCQIVRDIQEGVGAPYGAEKLLELLRMLPGAAEVARLRSFPGSPRQLADPELFMLLLTEVPSYAQRLELLVLKEDFFPRLSALRSSIQTLTDAAVELLECEELHTILHLILSAGNHLNSGGYAGSAAGFRLASLLKLPDTKANEPGMDLLHFVAMDRGGGGGGGAAAAGGAAGGGLQPGRGGAGAAAAALPARGRGGAARGLGRAGADAPRRGRHPRLLLRGRDARWPAGAVRHPARLRGPAPCRCAGEPGAGAGAAPAAAAGAGAAEASLGRHVLRVGRGPVRRGAGQRLPAHAPAPPAPPALPAPRLRALPGRPAGGRPPRLPRPPGLREPSPAPRSAEPCLAARSPPRPCCGGTRPRRCQPCPRRGAATSPPRAPRPAARGGFSSPAPSPTCPRRPPRPPPAPRPSSAWLASSSGGGSRGGRSAPGRPRPPPPRALPCSASSGAWRVGRGTGPPPQLRGCRAGLWFYSSPCPCSCLVCCEINAEDLPGLLLPGRRPRSGPVRRPTLLSHEAVVAPGCLRRARHSAALAPLPGGPVAAAPCLPPPRRSFAAVPQHLAQLPQWPRPLPGAGPGLACGHVPAKQPLRRPCHCALCCWAGAGRARQRGGGRCRTPSPVGAVPGLATPRHGPASTGTAPGPQCCPSCPGSWSQGARSSLKHDLGGGAEAGVPDRPGTPGVSVHPLLEAGAAVGSDRAAHSLIQQHLENP